MSTYIKLLKHEDGVFHEGICKDPASNGLFGAWNKSGLEFTTIDRLLFDWKDGYGIYEVTIPNLTDVCLSANYGSFKAKRIILGQRRELYDADTIAWLKQHGINMDSFTVQVVINGQVESLKKLLQIGVDASLADDDGNSLLHHAMDRSHLSAVKCLIEAGADLEAKNKFGSTPLHYAVHWIDGVNLLLKHGVEIDPKTTDGTIPLMKAIKRGDLTVAKKLIEAGADIKLCGLNSYNKSGWTLLQKAVNDNDTNMVEFLISNGADLNKTSNGNGYTALELAVANDRGVIAKKLLEAGADPNVNIAIGDTALNEALKAGANNSTIELLLQYGAKLNTLRSCVCEAVLAAAQKGSIERLSMLIDGGADVNAVNSRGNSALCVAVRNRKVEAVKLLVEAKVNIDFLNEDKMTSLYWAAREGYTELVQILLDAGSDKEKGKYTPLMAAAAYLRSDVAKLLIEAGADLNAQDETYGYSPLHWAVRANCNKKNCELFIDAGANLLLKDKENKVPLDHTRSNEARVVIEARMSPEWLLQRSIRGAVSNGCIQSLKGYIEDDDFIKGMRVLMLEKKVKDAQKNSEKSAEEVAMLVAELKQLKA